MKLVPKNIKILHDGLQIEKVILDNYPSIEAFSKLSGYSLKSLYNYCHSTPFGNTKFRSKLQIMTGKGYNEIFLTPQEQTQKLLKTIEDSIDIYNEEIDKEIFERLKAICLKNSFMGELAYTYKLYGKYHYNNGNVATAIEYVNIAIQHLKNIIDEDLIISCYIDLITLYTRNNEFNKAKSVIFKIDSIGLKNTNKTQLFNYYYRSGIFFNEIDSKSAISYFENAVKYTSDRKKLSRVNIVLGLAYKRIKEYKKAIECYKTSLEYIDVQETTEVRKVLNNLALLYKDMGDNINAIEYAERAYNYFGTDIDMEFTTLFTYLYISGYENPEKSIDTMIRFISEKSSEIKKKINVIFGIREIIQFAKEADKKDKLHKLGMAIIYNLLPNQNNKEYVSNLKQCLGDIYLLTIGGD